MWLSKQTDCSGAARDLTLRDPWGDVKLAAMPKKRILFVDDRPDHLRQPILRLQVEGYEVDDADSGIAALTKLHEGHYDLLILDADLPDEDGWGVLRAVRKDHSVEQALDLRVAFDLC